MDSSLRPPALLRIYQSPIGKKLITGITGLGLVAFVIVHLVGNLLLFAGRDAYNRYADHLQAWGPLLWGLEGLLVGVFVLHAIAGLQIFIGRLRARPEAYATDASRGQPPLQAFSSRTMILSGGLLGAFLVLHLLTFKFGPYYETSHAGKTQRDLARLVIETFQQPAYVAGYSAVLGLLGLHLRHGFWSALQSLGMLSRAVRWPLIGLSGMVAVAVALGFLALPWAIYGGLIK